MLIGHVARYPAPHEAQASGGAPGDPAASATPPLPEQPITAEAVVTLVGEFLRQRRYADAVRIFLESQSRGIITADQNLLDDLIGELGPELTAQLISAFAHHPCPACISGLERCSECAGQGMRQPEQHVCPQCIGSGTVRCDFCGGSGLVHYNVIPSPMRFPVLKRRVNIVTRSFEKLLASPPPDDEVNLLTHILNLNKLLAVLENAVVAASAQDQQNGWAPSALYEAVMACRDFAPRLDHNIRGALHRLAQSCADRAMINPLSQRKADYYESLSQATSFERTCLHHPQLFS
ncbi:MAG TPA: hypothetical protein VH518_24905 [Tepidisphaeraceae bacterium]|jgi:hypothetical protein